MSKELNVEDLKFRPNLVFAKSPYDKIVISNIDSPVIEKKLRMDPQPQCFARQAEIGYFNFPKSDISKLIMEPPTEAKEFIKTKEKECVKFTINESISIKISEPNFISREDWENRDFIKLEKWFLIPNKNSNSLKIIGYRSDIEEVNLIT
jgi:hypothetical protein